MACCTFFEFPMIPCHGIHASHCPALFGLQLESLKVSKSALPSGCCQGNHEVQECKRQFSTSINSSLNLEILKIDKIDKIDKIHKRDLYLNGYLQKNLAVP